MKLILAAIALLFAVASVAPAFAESKCCEQTNGGGNVPNGTAVGVPNTNNGGGTPPGQQPSPPGQDK